jgi:hypothetical protein
MALPKKGSRNIIVDDHSYRWIATKNDSAITLTVASSEFNGQTMLACFDLFTKKLDEDRYFIITPYIVRQTILYGLKNGWEPLKPGGQVHLKNITEKLDTSSTGSRKTKKLIKLLRAKNSSEEIKNEILELDLLKCEEFLRYGEWFVGLEILLESELAEMNFKLTDEMFTLIDEIIRATSDNLKTSKDQLSEFVQKLKLETRALATSKSN